MPKNVRLTDDAILKTIVWYFSALLGKKQDLASNTDYSKKLGQLIHSLSDEPYNLSFVCAVTKHEACEVNDLEHELVGRGILDPMYNLTSSVKKNKEYAAVLADEYGALGLNFIRKQEVSCEELKKLLPYMVLLVHKHALDFGFHEFTASYNPTAMKKPFDAQTICSMSDASRDSLLTDIFRGGKPFLDELENLCARTEKDRAENKNFFRERAQRLRRSAQNAHIIKTHPGLSDVFLNAMQAYASSGNLNVFCQMVYSGLSTHQKSLNAVDCRAALVMLPSLGKGVVDRPIEPPYLALSKSISELHDYAEKNHYNEVMLLAVQLNRELMLFQKEVNNSKNPLQLNLFYAKFSARLHSMDDTVAQHKYPRFDRLRECIMKIWNALKLILRLHTRATYDATLTLFGKTEREKKMLVIESVFYTTLTPPIL